VKRDSEILMMVEKAFKRKAVSMEVQELQVSCLRLSCGLVNSSYSLSREEVIAQVVVSEI
jgi:hypothetical protein